jgi:UDP-3-O-[3-hydroxymyristoyl] glucosamine N-acyltransferase
VTARELSLSAIVDLLGDAVVMVRGRSDVFVAAPAPLDNATNLNLSFCSGTGNGAVQSITHSQARVVLADEATAQALPDEVLMRTSVVSVDRPRLRFIHVLQQFFAPPALAGVHPTAVVEPRCRLGKDIYVGPFAYVAADSIGDGSVIHGHVHIYPTVTVGARVVIHAGAVVGADGFGYERDSNGKLHKFPQVGGVVIEDDVEIGANACIDRGALGMTVIRRGTKLDDLVYIAHNVMVGTDVVVVGAATLLGSSQIGACAWVSAGSTVRDKRVVGERAVIGLGAAVVADVPAGATVIGVPARAQTAPRARRSSERSYRQTSPITSSRTE